MMLTIGGPAARSHFQKTVTGDRSIYEGAHSTEPSGSTLLATQQPPSATGYESTARQELQFPGA
jgi:hypothetical protein